MNAPLIKCLIEVDLPMKRISVHARREKSIRHGHISTLHIWWALEPFLQEKQMGGNQRFWSLAQAFSALYPDTSDEKRWMGYWQGRRVGVLMAQEGPEYRTMVEAFARHLQQLYPKPTTLYSEFKKVKPVRLKPDVDLKRSDG